MTEADLTLKIIAKEIAADQVVTFRLADPNGAELPAWEPGAHIDVVISDELIRQYSLCGDPSDRSYFRIGVLNEVDGRGGSRHIAEHWDVGHDVVVRGPRNHFELRPSPNYLFIAGGIGITPLLTMAAKATRQGTQWKMLYGGRTRQSMAFLQELAAHDPNVTIAPQDETGLLDLASWLGTPQPDTLVYCCGPEPLLNAVEKACEAWPAKSLHVERFSPKALTEPARASSFDVILAQTGITLTVPPEKSILTVLQEANIPVMTSCGSGTCASCETRVLAGIPDHRDSVLDAEEQAQNDIMMVCVSRSLTSTLTLDL